MGRIGAGAVLVAAVIALAYFWESLKINVKVFLIFQRGILATNCRWWRVSDLFLEDGSGINLFYELKRKYSHLKAVPVIMLFNRIYVVSDVGYVKTILDHSPEVFGVGRLKWRMFKSFMEKNVGVSQGCPWRPRRILNEQVLDTVPVSQIDSVVGEIFGPGLPTNFEEFLEAGRRISSSLVFGRPDLGGIYNIFAEANSLGAVVLGYDPISAETRAKYNMVLLEQMAKPIPGSMVSRAMQVGAGTGSCPGTEDKTAEIFHQIPHWMFPIANVVATTFPRLLLILQAHQQIWEQIRQGRLIRESILEMFRLNNVVTTTFRTLLRDFTFPDGTAYPKGAQFLILNNPILRDPDVFPEPNHFIPQRWTPQLENSYYAIMFNQGPQKCPGKEVAIDILASCLRHWDQGMTGTPTINPKYIPQMINPCAIHFTS